ncbi:MAG: 30S ribosomal protein S9, partial [Microcystaceae cyanobacterium]
MSDSQTKAVYWGTGRRKAAIARVRLIPGQGEITVNGRPGDIYFNQVANYLQSIKAPLETL